MDEQIILIVPRLARAGPDLHETHAALDSRRAIRICLAAFLARIDRESTWARGLMSTHRMHPPAFGRPAQTTEMRLSSCASPWRACRWRSLSCISNRAGRRLLGRPWRNRS